MCSQKGLLDFRNVKLYGLLSLILAGISLSCYSPAIFVLGSTGNELQLLTQGPCCLLPQKPPKTICLQNGHGCVLQNFIDGHWNLNIM